MSLGKLIFMGSDSIAIPSLEALREGRCGDIEIEAVYTQPDRPRGRGRKIAANAIKLWALDNRIPVFQPQRMGRRERFEIEAIRPDAILVMAYGHLLSQKLIDTPSKGIWNLHTSILPRYRGASPIQGAIVSGESETGVSLMKVVRKMDAGPILDVERAPINFGETALDLEGKLALASVSLLERNMSGILAGDVSPAGQVEENASYTRKLVKADAGLDFNQPAVALARRINGLFPWPGARFEYRGVLVKVGLAGFRSADSPGKPGEIIGLDEDGLAICCGEGTLCLKKLQRPGGKMLASAEFARGFALKAGEVVASETMTELVASSLRSN